VYAERFERQLSALHDVDAEAAKGIGWLV